MDPLSVLSAKELPQTNYQCLDTYPATLHNEDVRKESVTEIQDRETGHLLCYANPDFAENIVSVMNGRRDLMITLAEAVEELGKVLADVDAGNAEKPENSRWPEAHAIIAKMKEAIE